ncbi:glycoside hydrolase family 28 [Mucilaginibacter sp. BJC16-A38]|uniref:glycoside hydrolase family 28 protein n=1 Tax=Mucilaginibacter phenanthrenivorans TaxID=1234842 RepID=UPI0021577EEE|nr:glycosyl hydrolase family 28 protein [Mucilaginibacter phenanthrenivorans]MCR8557753.1 glycoside hydrolase family 28 [Mucilaginibacter phenanthrenivorans]
MKYFFKIFFAVLLPGFTSITVSAQIKTYNIKHYGAIADVKINNTAAIQKAIDEASANGGGRVLVPAGKFVTGVINLKSNVELHIDKNAFLLGSAIRADYGEGKASPLIVSNNQRHIAITGQGTIDGQGLDLLKDIYRRLNAGTLADTEWRKPNPWHQMRPTEDNRPKLIEFKGCDDINIKDITIKNGLCWIQNYKNCSNLVIDSIKVESVTYWNNDGIDIVDCKNVKLTNSFFNAADDGICLKSEDRDGACENIYVANCRVRSSASAVKFGTASHGAFKKITIRNISVYDTYRSAIAIETVDGATLEDIDIRDITATNTGNALVIRLGHRNQKVPAGILRRVYIGNVKVDVPAGKPDAGYTMEGPLVTIPHNVFPSSITGIPGSRVEDVTLENITINYAGGAKKERAYFGIDTLEKVPERIPNYPEFSMFGELPAWGFYIRHADGIMIKNMVLTCKGTDYRPAFIADDVKGLSLTGLSIPQVKRTPVILLNKVSGLVLKNIRIPGNAEKNIKAQ